MTFEAIEEQGVETLLEQLRDELTGHTYEPLPARRERSAGNPHATFCGNRRRATASGDPVGRETERAPQSTATAPVLDFTHLRRGRRLADLGLHYPDRPCQRLRQQCLLRSSARPEVAADAS